MPGYKGKQGRKKKPDYLKVVQGTFRKDRQNKNQPTPKRAKPKSKRGLLTAEEKKHYDRLVDVLFPLGVVTEADVFALELLAQAYGQYYEARNDMRDQPKLLVYKNKNGDPVVKKNPLIAIMNEARRTIIQMLSRFGLEPSSRAALNIIPENPESENKGNKWDSKAK